MSEEDIRARATAQLPEHLRLTETDRGLQHAPTITTSRGQTVRVYESSAAEDPCLWLAVGAHDSELFAHLSAEQAWKLADQIRHLVQHHYQGDARPEGDAV